MAAVAPGHAVNAMMAGCNGWPAAAPTAAESAVGFYHMCAQPTREVGSLGRATMAQAARPPAPLLPCSAGNTASVVAMGGKGQSEEIQAQQHREEMVQAAREVSRVRGVSEKQKQKRRGRGTGGGMKGRNARAPLTLPPSRAPWPASTAAAGWPAPAAAPAAAAACAPAATPPPLPAWGGRARGAL